MTFVVNQHVFWFQIPEDDIQIVEIFKRDHCFSRKEPGLRGTKERGYEDVVVDVTSSLYLFFSEAPFALFLDVCKHFATIDKLQHKVEGLKGQAS